MMVLRRVRIMIGGCWSLPEMIPSSVGSLDMAISDFDRAGIEFLPVQQALMHASQHFAGAGDGIFRAFDLNLVAAGADIDAKPVLYLDEIGIEFAEQRAEHGLFVEFHFHPGAPRRIAAVFGMGECRLCVGTVCFAGHALLSAVQRSCCQPEDSGAFAKGKLPCEIGPWKRSYAWTGCNSRPDNELGPASTRATRTISPISASPSKCTD